MEQHKMNNGHKLNEKADDMIDKCYIIMLTNYQQVSQRQKRSDRIQVSQWGTPCSPSAEKLLRGKIYASIIV